MLANLFLNVPSDNNQNFAPKVSENPELFPSTGPGCSDCCISETANDKPVEASTITEPNKMTDVICEGREIKHPTDKNIENTETVPLGKKVHVSEKNALDYKCVSLLEVEEIEVKDHSGKFIENERDPGLHPEIHGPMNQAYVITEVGTENYTAIHKSTKRTNNQPDAVLLSKNLNESEIAEVAGKTENKILYPNKISNLSDGKTRSKPKEDSWECHTCFRQFNKKELYGFHVINHSKMRFKCPEPGCGYKFMFIDSLQSHVNGSPLHKIFWQYDKRTYTIPMEGSMVDTRPADNSVNPVPYFGKQQFNDGCFGKYVNNGERRRSDASIQNWPRNIHYELPVNSLKPVSRSVDNGNNCNTSEHFTISLNHCRLQVKHRGTLPQGHKFPTAPHQFQAERQKHPTATFVPRSSYNWSPDFSGDVEQNGNETWIPTLRDNFGSKSDPLREISCMIDKTFNSFASHADGGKKDQVISHISIQNRRENCHYKLSGNGLDSASRSINNSNEGEHFRISPNQHKFSEKYSDTLPQYDKIPSVQQQNSSRTSANSLFPTHCTFCSKNKLQPISMIPCNFCSKNQLQPISSTFTWYGTN